MGNQNTLKNTFVEVIRYLFSKPFRYTVRTNLRNEEYIPIGSVDFGDLRRLTPVSNHWGDDRGQPIDRYYIENFIASHAYVVKGNILEIGDNRYTLKHGKGKSVKSDVLNLLEDFHPSTTIVGDITSAPQIPSDSYDCILFIQTLQLIYDVRAAIDTLHRILKPGGVLLITFSAISQSTDSTWGEYWCWNFTSLSARKMFSEFFPEENVEVSAYGNVLVATAFLQGLSREEMTDEELEYYDPNYQICVCAKVTKPD